MITTENLISMPNLLLIAGNGRNVGKTTMGCRLVESIKGAIAIKVSPHPHPDTENLDECFKTDNILIAKETHSEGKKDSNRYLKAGAKAVFYVRCSDEYLPLLVKWIKSQISYKIPIICESGGIGKYIKPGAAAYIKDLDNKKPDPLWPFSFHQVLSKQGRLKDWPQIIFKERKWQITS